MQKYKNPILDSRGELFGLATLMIVYHHLGNRGIPGISALPSVLGNILDFIFAKAYIGVDIFIFLSAIDLCYSMERNSVAQFYKNRLHRVATPWFVIMIPVFIIEDILICKEGAFEFLLDTSTLRYWVDNDNTHTPWFVPFIVLLYFLFPLIYKADKKTNHISTLLLFVFMVGVNIYYNCVSNYIYSKFTFCFARLPIFLLGVLLSGFIKRLEDNTYKKSFIAIIITKFTIYFSWYFLNLPTGLDMLVGGLVAIGLILFYAYIIKPMLTKGISRAFVYIGTVSLEVYLIHTVILRVIDASVVPDIWFLAQYVLLPMCSIFIAKAVMWVIDKTISIVNKKSTA